MHTPFDIYLDDALRAIRATLRAAPEADLENLVRAHAMSIVSHLRHPEDMVSPITTSQIEAVASRIRSAL